MHDVVIVGAGTVGATIALSIAGNDLDVVAIEGRTPGVTMRQDNGEQVECVAVEVADLDQLPPGMIGIQVPARRYALMTHRGPMVHAQASRVTGTAAMEQLGMEADEEGIRLERYDRRYTPTVDDGARPDNAYDILVPLYG